MSPFVSDIVDSEILGGHVSRHGQSLKGANLPVGVTVAWGIHTSQAKRECWTCVGVSHRRRLWVADTMIITSRFIQ